MTTLYIKNMVCDRCIMAVEQTLKQSGLTVLNVELGKAEIDDNISNVKKEQLSKRLRDIGFEILDNRRLQTIEKIKNLIISLVHYKNNKSLTNLSDYLQEELHQDYSSLSKLFSEYTSKTIERYYIEQRIERVKELLTYGELTLTQIAIKMNYSSTAYLSSQFKSVTGMSPSQFKRLQFGSRKSLDKI